MNYSPIKINEGINLHLINTNKFKTNIISNNNFNSSDVPKFKIL